MHWPTCMRFRRSVTTAAVVSHDLHGRDHRVKKIANLWWDQGMIPDELKSNLSMQEVAFFEGYDRLMGKYMSSVGLELNLVSVPQRKIVGIC